MEVDIDVVEVGDRLVHEIERSEDQDGEHQVRRGEGDRVEEVRAAHGGPSLVRRQPHASQEANPAARFRRDEVEVD